MVKLVTDSVSDLPPEVVKKLEITVIPLHVHFGQETYKDRVDLSSEDFYQKLEHGSTFPSTSAPSPGLFAGVFDDLAMKCNQILGVFVSRKLSATYDAALQGVKLMKKKCQVEIVDSALGIMGEGLLVMEAAKRALAGAKLGELTSMISKNIPRIHIRVSLDTLEYLARGGRIGKVQALMGSMLKMNPILGIKDGVAFPAARVRSRAKATDWLCEFASKFNKVKALAVEYGTNVAEAEALAKRIASVFPKVPIYLSNVSPVIGTHTGPNVLSVTVMED
ncbi:MAG: DegV family protein [Chloroflexota bacterium]|nr:MAG: DegV family protein [Chloroflexota bacterium]